MCLAGVTLEDGRESTPDFPLSIFWDAFCPTKACIFFIFSKLELSFKIQAKMKRCFLSIRARFPENPEIVEFPKSEPFNPKCRKIYQEK